MTTRFLRAVWMSVSLATFACAAHAQTTSVHASLDNINVRTVYTGTTTPNYYYFLDGRTAELSSEVSISGLGSDGRMAHDLRFDTPAAVKASVGTSQARATVDGPLGEIGTTATGLGPSAGSSWNNRAESKVTQQVHVKIGRGDSLQINGTYSISAGSGTPEFVVTPGLAEFSVRFDSLSAPDLPSVEFSKQVYASSQEAGGTLASGFELIAVNPYDYAIEGVLTFYSHSYVSVSAVPEPGTYMMLGAGLLVLAGTRLRRNRRAGTPAI